MGIGTAIYACKETSRLGKRVSWEATKTTDLFQQFAFLAARG
jgi:hypothetical protein